MKKIIIYILILLILIFIIPVFFTKITVESNSLVNNNELQQIGQTQITNESYNYKNYNTIKLVHTKDNSIEEIGLDEYLYGVVSAEMPVDFELEALKAQAIVARTYTIYKITQNESKHGDAHICDSSACCQAWILKEDRLARWEQEKGEENWNKIVLAVNDTKGKIITYENEPINAFFHSNSGGTTEVPLNVWGGQGYPYLQVVQTSGEDTYTQYNSEVILSKEDFINKIKEKHSDFEIDFSKENEISILEYTESGRVKTIKIGNLNLSGVEVRTILGLKSANFTVTIDENNIKFSVIGYGHGVGMSQTGADSLAKQGKTCDEIIKHYYVGVEITNL